MMVIAYDPFVSAERYRELGRRAAPRRRMPSTRAPTSSRSTCPKTDETLNYVNAAAFAQMKDGVRIVNCARGELLDLDALGEALESGKVAGASLDVFPDEPVTDHPIFAHENVVVTPHLGASTTEAQDRAGVITAEQVVAALNGELVSNAVNIPTGRQRGPGGARALPAAVDAARAASRCRSRESRLRRPASRSPTTGSWPSSTRAC